MNHEKHLKFLLKKISNETPNNQQFSERFWIPIPYELELEDEDFSKFQSLELSDKEANFYHNSFKELRSDSRTEFLKDNELKNKLDTLCAT